MKIPFRRWHPIFASQEKNFSLNMMGFLFQSIGFSKLSYYYITKTSCHITKTKNLLVLTHDRSMRRFMLGASPAEVREVAPRLINSIRILSANA